MNGGVGMVTNSEKHTNVESSKILFSFLMFTPRIFSSYLEFVELFNEVIHNRYKHILVVEDEGLYIISRKYRKNISDTMDDFMYLKYLKQKIETQNSDKMIKSNLILFKLSIIDVHPVCLFKRCDLFKVKNLYRYFVELTITSHDIQYMKLDEISSFIIKQNIGYIYNYTKYLIKKNFQGYPFWFKCQDTLNCKV